MKKFETFEDITLPSALNHSLQKMQFIHPTPVQKAAIPHALEGKDILGTAQTGTGKTGAFGIPLLSHLYHEPTKIALILAPTRELAAQIHTVLGKMSKALKFHGVLIVGGESFSRQVRELERGIDFIVATPGRLNDHLQERTLHLKDVSFLVLDEVDRMLDMGFAPQIQQIMKHVPSRRQTLLFSATLPQEASSMAERFLNEPVRVDIAPVERKFAIEEKTIQTTAPEKSKLVLSEVHENSGKVLIFTRTKSRTDKVARVLGKNGHKVVNLHGGRTQGQRKRALSMFRSGTHPIMVATDIAGRGIDVEDIELVINFDIPQSREDYIHRIGRTGRNGKPGKAINYVTSDDFDVELILTGKKSSQPSAKRPAQRGGRKKSSFSRGFSKGPRHASKSSRFKKKA